MPRFFQTRLSTLKVCSTSYNKCSSSSHSVLKIKKDGKHMIFIDLAGQEKNSDKDSQFININYSYITCLLQDLKKGLSINKNTIIEKCLAEYFKLSNHLIIILTIANNQNSIDAIKKFPFKHSRWFSTRHWYFNI